MPESLIIDPTLCPVCGRSNQCTLADPRTVGRLCWCFSTEIDATALQAIPEALRDKACLCPNCAARVDPKRD